MNTEWEAERQFIRKRFMWPPESPRYTGISSDAMVAYALGGEFPVERPRDRGDMGACDRTLEMAPKHLRSRMEEVMTVYREFLAAYERQSD